MSVIRVSDKGGNCVSYRDVDGYWLPPPFQEDIFRNVRHLKIREDDIIIANWMRSGTHWLFEMVSMLINNKAETIPKKKEDHMMEFTETAKLDALPSPRVLNTHLHFRVLPEDLKSKECRVIYLIRDPKDVAVSWFNMHRAYKHYDYQGKWQDWLPLFLEGKMDWKSWFDHITSWEQVFKEQPNLKVHLVHYEDLKVQPTEELKKLSRFLGLDRSQYLFDAIAAKCEISKMRQDKLAFTWDEGGNPVHYRKGIAGEWKTYFTVDQLEDFQTVYHNKLKCSNIQSRYNVTIEYGK